MSPVRGPVGQPRQDIEQIGPHVDTVALAGFHRKHPGNPSTGMNPWLRICVDEITNAAQEKRPQGDRSGGKLSFYESLRCRVRYFSDGCAIGAGEFVERVLAAHRERFGSWRQSGIREMRSVDLRGLCTVRTLRRQVVRPSCASNS